MARFSIGTVCAALPPGGGRGEAVRGGGHLSPHPGKPTWDQELDVLVWELDVLVCLFYFILKFYF